MAVTFKLLSADPSSDGEYSQDSTNICGWKELGMEKGKTISSYLGDYK